MSFLQFDLSNSHAATAMLGLARFVLAIPQEDGMALYSTKDFTRLLGMEGAAVGFGRSA